ncbi:Enzyme that catalyzes the fourth step in the histidine pathway [Xylographa bjoerkii]|nr:Enzyme that catalyzes the fourth step in the histidine pathway [Xylographa bjoerkii]
MTIFRPCIDLHAGRVKQIVGGTLDSTSAGLQTNHVSDLPASHFAKLYREHGLHGAHVIMLGPGNEDAAREALKEWPGVLQLGGGINEGNAGEWMRAGAGKVIVTSSLFPAATFSLARLQAILRSLDDDPAKLVIDLSCRRAGPHRWVVAMDKWQRLTDMEVTQGVPSPPSYPILYYAFLTAPTASIQMLEPYCSEFLIHAADHEGLQRGIDEELVRRLGEWCRVPVTYAGGARAVGDLERVRVLSGGKVDLTIGSALDVFGGAVRFEECVKWNARWGGGGDEGEMRGRGEK